MRHRIFFGSSTEGRPVCEALVAELQRHFDVEPWYENVGPGQIVILAVQESLARCQFGVFVLSADDQLVLRERDVVLPRDNVLFEAGLSVGMHGLARSFLVCPSNAEGYHLSSDLDGVVRVQYDHTLRLTPGALTKAAAEIHAAIVRADMSKRNVSVSVLRLKNSVKEPPLTWPVKLELMVRNDQTDPVVVESLGFAFRQARPARNDFVLGGARHNVAFPRWLKEDGSNKDQYHTTVVLQPGEEIEAWVAFDASYTQAELDALRKDEEMGAWTYRTTWLGRQPKVFTHEKVLGPEP